MTNHDAGFGIYVHWPFCAAKCPYCDFNSHVRRETDHARWRAALIREAEHMAALTGRRAAVSLFFGGGTPSLMEPETVRAVIDRAAGLWSLGSNAEITLEANPTSVDAGRFAGYRAAGVNRVSVGVQSLHEADLTFLGRLHSVAEARSAIALARETFPRLSFDLIYARPGQTVAAWEAELRAAIDLAADHLSLYQLTIEPETPFHDLHARGAFAVPDGDLAADLYDITQTICADAGLPAYEISNHARPGAESRHNLVYWRYGDYAGIGPGAHGRLTIDGEKHALATIRNPEAWLDQVERLGHGIESDETVPRHAQGEEWLMMGLRLAEGVDPARFRALSGTDLDLSRVRDLTADGLLDARSNRLKATPAGRRVLNGVLSALLA